MSSPCFQICLLALLHDSMHALLLCVCLHPPAQAVLVGRTRDANDRVQWLIGQGRWDAALVLAESAGKEVAPETFEQVRVLTCLPSWLKPAPLLFNWCFPCEPGSWGPGVLRYS
jgi:hypothetical protein